MKKRVIATLTLLSIIVSLFNVPVITAQEKKYEDPLLMATADTFIRFGRSEINGNSEILTVDSSSGNHRITFVEFSLEGYEPYVENASKIYFNLHASVDAGAVEDVNTISVYPLEDEYKEIDLSTLTYSMATEVTKDGVSLIDYMPETEVYSAIQYRNIKVDVTEYCKSQDDLRVIFMVKALTGAFSMHSSEAIEDGSEPSLEFESEYTNILNGAVDAANGISEKYNDLSFFDDIPFETTFGGYNVALTSDSPEYITDEGEVLMNPSSDEGSKDVTFQVSITHDDYPLINETAEFTIHLLSEGSFSADQVEVADDEARIDFCSPLPSGSKFIMSINSSELTDGEEYALYAGSDLIYEFIADRTKVNMIFDVSDFITEEDNIFTLRGEFDGDWNYMPVITSLSESGLDAVMDLYYTDLGDLENVTSDLNLPSGFGDYEFTWESSNKSALADSGRVERGDVDEVSVLTATISGDDLIYKMDYIVTIIRENTDAENNRFPVLNDPLHTSDEEFFGQWDIDDGSWSVEPIINYGQFDGLSSIEDAVKRGDYTNARKLLLAYYRQKPSDSMITFVAEKTYDIQATAMLDKIWSFNENDKLISEVTIGSEWEWYSMDLNKNRNGTYWIMEPDMDGSYIEIESKENGGGHSAYVEVVAGGQKYTYPVFADTHISAGENSDVNYGGEEILISREAAGGEKLPWGANTRRPYLRFKLDAFDTAAVTSVKLNFYARAVGKESKKVYCLTSVYSKNFNESTFSWSDQYPNAVCFKETGYFWIHENEYRNNWGTELTWLLWSARLYQSEWLVKRYLKTLNEDYAYEALDFTLKMYTDQPEGLYPRNLESGWRVEYLLKTMFSTINSEHMTPEIFTALLKWVYAHGDELKDEYVSTANWTSAFKTNLARICAYTPEIEGDGWWEQVKDDLRRLYSDTVLNPDGSYTESCANYISGVLNEWAAVMEILRTRDGEDDEYYIYFQKQLRELLTYYTNMAYPTGRTPPYGDGARQAPYAANLKHNDYVKDENLQWILTGGLEGTKPDYTTKHYPKKGMIMFKSGWHAYDLCAFFVNDGGGSHSHKDDLALDVTAYGAYLLVDAGVSTYSAGSDFAAVRENTINHNTIEIDNMNQNETTRNTAGYTDLTTNGSFDYLRSASNDKMYTGFDVSRNVLMLKNKFIVVSDQIIPYDDQPHTYRQLWHPDQNFNLQLDPTTHLAKTNFPTDPNVKIVPAPTGEDAKIFTRMMYASGETTSRSVQYFKENVTGNQTFDTVIYPENVGVDTEISVTRLDLEGVPLEDATAFTININEDIGYFYSTNEEAIPQRTFGDYTYDGEMVYVEKNDDGDVTYIAMANGSLLGDDNTIVEFSERVEDFSAKFESSSLKLYASDELPEGGLKIASPKKYNTVYLNDEEVSFSYSDGYIITNGDEKSEDITEGGLRPGSPIGSVKPDKDDDDKDDSNSGSSGSSGGMGGTTFVPPVPAVNHPFTDSSNHWASDYIAKLHSKGIVAGVSENSFAPDREITRAEFTKMLISACGITTPATDSIFTDVDLNSWYAPYVAAAFSNGFVSGDGSGTFHPDSPITRQEMAKMLCVACDIIKKYDGSNKDITFTDNSLISDWAYLYVKKACGLGLFVGDNMNQFNPLRSATRAETATVICRLLGL